MKTAIISAVIAGLLGVANAAPATQTVDITFLGAAGASFDQLFPTDDSIQPISMKHTVIPNMHWRTQLTITLLANPLSVSQIQGHTDGYTCTFYGIDGSVTIVVGAQTVPVGPPQTQVSGSCSPS
jgi:hypothetical protein